MKKILFKTSAACLIAIIFGCGDSTPPGPTPAAQPASPRKTIDLRDILPPSQIRFIDASDQYSDKYQSAANELQKSTIWKQRSKALVQGGRPHDGEPDHQSWYGVLEQMGTTGEGNAFIVVRIAPSITLSTWNNEFSDTTEKTLIKNGSKDYLTLSNIQTGSVIRFKYAIDPDGKGLTEAGKMINPDFATRFSGISVVSADEIRKLAKIEP